MIDYIEEHVQEEMDPVHLAGLAGYSHYHFSKIFKKYTGYSTMDYVVKRKLQHALYELFCGKKVIDIALDYGFHTHAGFTKAFKKTFGSSPSLYKLHCPAVRPQKPDLMNLHKRNVGGIVLQPKLVSRQPFTVVGQTFESSMKNISFTRDEPAFWDERGLTDGDVERNLYRLFSPKRHGEYCMNINRNHEKFTYLFAVDYDEQHTLPEGYMIQKMPAANYAVFKTPAVSAEQFVSTIKGTWRYILEDWLPPSSYEVDEAVCDFEYYDEYCHYWDFEKIYMEIHLPIKKRAS
ncbi:AraC family transcriptional regulator [Cytobacillus purgationiresistens]|uniref:AraC family transcriptional regulator n=1 Tax=Cytobacillus purgationiresistens TaxID=863449 RepID=A0ABU0AQ02_9BACI|nr:AraC family transcriptional regulator [Cytobacillus purgationiresistens]